MEIRGPVGGWFVWEPGSGELGGEAGLMPMSPLAALPGAPVLLLAGGSGLVPLMAMVRPGARPAAGSRSASSARCAARGPPVRRRAGPPGPRRRGLGHHRDPHTLGPSTPGAGLVGSSPPISRRGVAADLEPPASCAARQASSSPSRPCCCAWGTTHAASAPSGSVRRATDPAAPHRTRTTRGEGARDVAEGRTTGRGRRRAGAGLRGRQRPGGPLGAVFRAEVTTAVGTCRTCGKQGALAEIHLWNRAPGLVARCPGCEDVLLRVVDTPRAPGWT
ncbi:DUF6510 family protein [Oerskovia sp. M15]